MEEKLLVFEYLANLFKKNGFNLYLVGGTVRDYLLKLPLDDFDVVTNATPDDMHKFLLDASYTFEKYGSVRCIFNKTKFDITTLRKENSYSDSRHPSKIEFCDSLEEDVLRRDFTINALYMDKEGKVYDFVDGQKDLKDKIIKMIGDPDKRIKEDPLRIIRAFRFAVSLSFFIDKPLMDAILRNKELVKKLNPEKVNQDIKKCSNPEKLLENLKDLDIL
ncbi:MAG: CCA tRNA nucleotidyltransferase [Bacilli bacterium]|nr:CCA tRNA nucleotidyltransferase [Bacilli bacterium]